MTSLSCPTRTILNAAIIGEGIAIVSGYNPQEVISKTIIVASVISFVVGFIFSSVRSTKSNECIDSNVDDLGKSQDLEKNAKERNSFLKNKLIMCIGESIVTGAIAVFASTLISTSIGYIYLNS